MLTAELVQARRRGDELLLVPLDEASRARAHELAATFLEIAAAHCGRRRDELEEACAAIETAPRHRRLADGLRKLVEDRCTFEVGTATDPEALRRQVFLRASARRQAQRFDRAAILDEVAAEVGMSAAELEVALYADLRGAHTLTALEPIGAARLVEEYELGQAQAVLLRAVKVTVEVECGAPGAYRALFHRLKFLRLLYRLEPRAEGGYRLEIDGPFSLFESVTKYGLQLALALPAIRACDRFRLQASVRWGKERQPLQFRLAGEVPSSPSEPPRLADEVARLLGDLRALESPWQVAPAADLIHLPGVGLCVPDLVFVHSESGECVYLEVLGFWSRDAVWRRVELVQRGIKERIVFAVSQHLRVSEAALDQELPSALYVYKRVMSARAVLSRIEEVARR